MSENVISGNLTTMSVNIERNSALNAYLLFLESMMRKLPVLLSAVAVLLVTGCAAQRYPSNYQNPYPSQNQAPYPNQNPYPTQHPTQYPNQYQQPNQGQYQAPYPNQNQNVYVENAVIVGMREVAGTGGNPSGAGAVVGALVGGVLGHQVGKGTGRDLATVGGAIAGGLVGNELERGSSPKNRTELTLRMQNGEQRTLLVDSGMNFRLGDQIRVSYQNGQMILAP